LVYCIIIYRKILF